MLRRYVTFVVSVPKVVIALVVAVTIGLAFFVTRLKVHLDIDEQIPPGHPLVVVGKRVEKAFGGKYLTVVGVYPKSGTIYSKATLEKVQRIQLALEKIPGVRAGSVISLMSPRVKDIKSTDDALEVSPLAPKVPETETEMAAFRDAVKRNHVITSLLVSDDGRATAILVDFEDFEKAGGAGGHGKRSLARDPLRLTSQDPAVWDRLEKIFAAERDANTEILCAGATSILYWLQQYTSRVALLFVVALAMIGYLHYRAFRTLQGMIVPLVTAIMGVLWALGLMGLIRAPMDPWNIMTPILLLAIGAGHSVQILKRYYEEYSRAKTQHPEKSPADHNRTAVIEATVKVGIVMLAAGTIASLSFASLYAFDLPSIRNFGLCSAFGIVAALVVEMTFIPAIRVLMSPPTKEQTDREKREEYFDPILEGLARIVREKKERPILWVFSGLIVLAAIGASRLGVGNSLGEQFFERNVPVRGFRMADERMAGTRVIQVLVEGKAQDAIKDPEVLKRMDALATFVAKHPLKVYNRGTEAPIVGKVVSIVDVLKQIGKAIRNDPAAADALPETVPEVAQYLLLYSMSGDDADLSRLLDRDAQRAVITAYIKTDDFRAMKALVEAMQAEADRLFKGQPVTASVGGGVTNAIALNETMVAGKTKNLLQISLLVVIITSILLRSFTGGLLVLLPLATSALVNMGLMGFTGILLSMGTAAISAMAVGIGADYAVYFLFRVREEFGRVGDLREATAIALTTSGKAIAYVASAVAGGYICLALSLLKVHVLLGVLVALTMVTASAATVAFLPAVVLRVAPGFLTRKSAKAS